MTKADVIVEISDKTGIDKADVSSAIESFFSVIKDNLAKGEAVYVRGFGSFVNKKRDALMIQREKNRSDDLLLNILPAEVAEELKTKGSADAKQFDEVTVMFTDFKGFTQISEKLSPTELVNEIHECFKAFDNIISKHNIEKIKTIGESH